MLGKCVELLVNLPGQSKGNIGEVVSIYFDFLTIEMNDGSFVVVLARDVKPL